MVSKRLSNDEIMELWKTKIGTVAKPGLNDAPFCTLITSDAILNYCLSVGDLNPLWIDEQHGLRSPYGCNLASPTMLYSIAPWGMGGTVFDSVFSDSGELLPRPGEGGRQGGITIEWMRHMRVGDKIACEARVADVRTRESDLWGKVFELVAEFTFKDQSEDPIAIARFPWLGTERRAVRQDVALETKYWTPTEIEEIRAEYACQPTKVRGAIPLYWEDVREGDSLPDIIKGPRTEVGHIAFCVGVPLRGIHAANEVFWQYEYERRIKGYPNRGPLGVLEVTRQGIPAGHRWQFDYESARTTRGLPAPADIGAERVCWLAQLLTMWMGDYGFLKSLHVQHVGFNLMGDLTRCKGAVTSKEIRGAHHLVHCKVMCENHRGSCSEGSATVVLPPKKGGVVADI